MSRIRPLALATLLAAAPLALAQAPAVGSADFGAYRVEFTLQETQSGKPAATHHYTLLVNRSGNSNIAVGSRVPVKSGADVTYQRVGFILDCTLPVRQALPAGEVALIAELQITAVAPNSPPLLPEFTGASARVDTAVPLGRSVSIAHFEDSTGARTYDLQVLAEPAK